MQQSEAVHFAHYPTVCMYNCVRSAFITSCQSMYIMGGSMCVRGGGMCGWVGGGGMCVWVGGGGCV